MRNSQSDKVLAAVLKSLCHQSPSHAAGRHTAGWRPTCSPIVISELAPPDAWSDGTIWINVAGHNSVVRQASLKDH